MLLTWINDQVDKFPRWFAWLFFLFMFPAVGMAARLNPTNVAPVLSVLSAANTNRDGSGTVVTCATGVSSKSEVNWIRVDATGTVTDGAIRFGVYDGTNTRYCGEIPVGNLIPTQTGKGTWFYEGPPPGGVQPLPSTSYELRAWTVNAETFHVKAYRTDF